MKNRTKLLLFSLLTLLEIIRDSRFPCHFDFHTLLLIRIVQKYYQFCRKVTTTGCTLFNDEWKKWKRFLTNGAEKLVRRRDRKASNEKSSLFVSPPVSSFIETYSWLSTQRNNVTARHDALYTIIIEPREPSAGGVNLDRTDNRIVCRLF